MEAWKPAWVGLIVALGAAACTAPTTHRDTSNNQQPDDASPQLGPYQPCGAPLPDGCQSGYVCTEIEGHHQSYCLRPCTTQAQCHSTERCVSAVGACLPAVDYFAACGALLEACPVDAFCFSNSTMAQSRCLPVCEAGELPVKTVEACPTLPAALYGHDSQCTPMPHGTPIGSFCAAIAPVGEVCDESLWQCNPAGTRPDTAPDMEAHEGWKPGALHCSQVGVAPRCMRVCSVDGGATESPCTCPVDDPACEDPESAGFAWHCVGLTSLPEGIRVCMTLAACDGDDACSPHAAEGLTACKTSPYTGGPESICAPP